MDRAILQFLNKDSVAVAQELIGWKLFVKEPDGSMTGGEIIETEAYNQDDAASHSYRGVTPRTKTMFGPAGHTYVYFTYGMHWCMNIVTGPEGRGEAVLIRAITPEKNIELIRERRNNRPDRELTDGPAKVCQALAINGSDNDKQLNQDRIWLLPPETPNNSNITATERIGIRHDTHRLWRFVRSEE